jgi:hypothetical protein
VYQETLKSWSWINENKNSNFLIMMNHAGYGPNCDGVARNWSRLQGTRDWMGSHVGAGTGDPECWAGTSWTREQGSQVA